MIRPVNDQPILFTGINPPVPCCGESDWNHEFFQTDLIPFQFELGPADGAETIIVNGNFTDFDNNEQTGWDKEGTSVAYNIGGDGAWLQGEGSIIKQTTGYTPGDWFLLKVKFVNQGSNEFEFPDANIEVGGIAEPFSFLTVTQNVEAYVQAGLDGFISFQLNLDSEGIAFMYIQSVELLPITMPIITTETKDGTELSTITTMVYSAPFLSVSFQPTSLEGDAKCFRFRLLASEDEDAQVYISELIEIVPNNNCSLLLGGCSQNNMYSRESDLYVRLKGKIRADAAPVYDRFTTRTNSGINRLNYANKTKIWTLYIDRVPEHVRDYLFSFPLFNTIGIKIGVGEQRNFFVHEEPDEPEFTTGDDQLASVQMQMKLKESLQETIYESECSFILPPKALGSKALELIIKAAENTGIKVP